MLSTQPTQHFSMRQIRGTLSVGCFLLAILVSLPANLFAQTPTQPPAAPASPADQAIANAKALYDKKDWDNALPAFQKALRLLRGKPIYQKVNVYLYIGLCLYQQGNQGLAWKSFEQALYQNTEISLPTKESSEIQQFFDRVKQRVKQRGGIGTSFSSVPSSSSSTPKPSASGGLSSPVPWILFASAGLLLTTGVLFFVNASANTTTITEWSSKAVQQEGHDPTVVGAATQPITDSASLQNILGGISVGIGALAIAGGIVYIILTGRSASPPKTTKAKAPYPTYASPSSPLSPTTVGHTTFFSMQ